MTPHSARCPRIDPAVVLACLVLAITLGHGPARGAAASTRPIVADGPLAWPAPPDTARIRFIREFRSISDLGRASSWFARTLRALVGMKGSGSARLTRPTDVYADDSLHVFVTDAASSQLLAFDLAARRVRVLGLSGPGALVKPLGLGGDGRGQLFVTDPPGRRVVVLGPAGEFVRAFGGPKTLINPVDVAVDPVSGRAFVVDSYLHQVLIFDPAGVLVTRIGRSEGDAEGKATEIAAAAPAGTAPGTASGPHDVRENRGGAPGEFLYPSSIALSSDGRVYVSDGLNGRVQVFDLEGRFVAAFGHLGDTPGSFARPKGIALDAGGQVYVMDAAFNNLQVFDAQGQLLMALGTLGREPGCFWLPLGIHVDRHDRIYVADRYNGRIQVFQYLEPSLQAPSDEGRIPPGGRTSPIEKGEGR